MERTYSYEGYLNFCCQLDKMQLYDVINEMVIPRIPPAHRNKKPLLDEDIKAGKKYYLSMRRISGLL